MAIGKCVAVSMTGALKVQLCDHLPPSYIISGDTSIPPALPIITPDYNEAAATSRVNILLSGGGVRRPDVDPLFF